MVALLLRANARDGTPSDDECCSPLGAGSSLSAGFSSRLRAAARGLARKLIRGLARGPGRLKLGVLVAVLKVGGSTGCCERGESSARDVLRLNPRLRNVLLVASTAAAVAACPPTDLLRFVGEQLMPDAAAALPVLLRLFAPHPDARDGEPDDLELRAELRPGSDLERRGMGVMRPMMSCRFMFCR